MDFFTVVYLLPTSLQTRYFVAPLTFVHVSLTLPSPFAVYERTGLVSTEFSAVKSSVKSPTVLPPVAKIR